MKLKAYKHLTDNNCSKKSIDNYLDIFSLVVSENWQWNQLKIYHAVKKANCNNNKVEPNSVHHSK